jgi:hypothetical protein
MRRFETSFAGAPKVPASYALTHNEAELQIEFRVETTPHVCPEAAAGEFYEGLWRFDCGELWLASPVTGRYIEFNLAPNGAWWACVFSAARVRDLGTAPPIVTTQGRFAAEGWTASLSVAWADIRRCLQDEAEPNANLTLVVGGCPDENAPLENLHTVCPLSEVDFHRPQDWQPLTKF